MKPKMVSYTPDEIPEISERRSQELRALAERPDSEIGYSDAPRLTEEQWANAVRGSFHRPVKQQITARLDADVIHWLTAAGKGHQSRMNAILRREMLADVKKGPGQR